MKLPSLQEPLRIQRLQHFKGFPVPWMMMLTDGVPDFKTLDLAKIIRCATERRCGICGEKLGAIIWFVGGHQSCGSRHFVDPPFHRECAEHSFEVCPYLLGRVDFSQAKPKLREGGVLIEGIVADSSVIGLYRTRGYHFGMGESTQGGMLVFVAWAAEEIIWKERKQR